MQPSLTVQLQYVYNYSITMDVFSILVARHDPSPAGATALVNGCAGDKLSDLDSIKMTLISVS